MTILLMIWILCQLHAPWIVWALFVIFSIEKLIAWIGILAGLTYVKERNNGR